MSDLAKRQSNEEIAELIARFRTPPGCSWEPLRNDIVTLLESRDREAASALAPAGREIEEARSAVIERAKSMFVGIAGLRSGPELWSGSRLRTFVQDVQDLRVAVSRLAKLEPCETASSTPTPSEQRASAKPHEAEMREVLDKILPAYSVDLNGYTRALAELHTYAATERASAREDRAGEIAELHGIIRELHWMARRYADGRMTYAVGNFNGITRRLCDADIIRARDYQADGTPWARDGTGKRSYDGLSDDEASMGVDWVARDQAMREQAVEAGRASARREAMEEAVKRDDLVGKWLSAALDDDAVCHEMKADINAWFAARPLSHPEAEDVLQGQQPTPEVKAEAWPLLLYGECDCGREGCDGFSHPEAKAEDAPPDPRDLPLSWRDMYEFAVRLGGDATEAALEAHSIALDRSASLHTEER